MKLIRSIISAITEGKIKLFSGSGRPGESFTDREYFQHYGFTSRPLNGAEAILIKDGNVIQVIASDDRRYRLSLADGEVALYSDEGDKIHLKRNREIEVVGGEKVTVSTNVAEVSAETSAKVTSPSVEVIADTEVTITSPTTTISGNVSVGGNLSVTGTGTVTGALSSTTSVSDSTGSMQSIRGTYNSHTHGGSVTPTPQM